MRKSRNIIVGKKESGYSSLMNKVANLLSQAKPTHHKVTLIFFESDENRLL
jgi:hypothetical protein